PRRTDAGVTRAQPRRSTLVNPQLPRRILGSLDLTLHAAKKLIHHHPSGRQQDPLADARDHPADLTVAFDVDLRSALGIAEPDRHVTLDEARTAGAFDGQAVAVRRLLVRDLDVTVKRAL